MEDVSVRDPYGHMSLAAKYEAAEDFRRAENQWRMAARAADTLPLAEYRRTMKVELVRYQAEPEYQVKAGVTEGALRHAYSEVMALPFIVQIEMASFYARHGAFPEARESCNQAFNRQPEAECLKDVRVCEMYRRAQMMKTTLDAEVGPEEMDRLLMENFSQIDKDGNGFLSHAELEQAQFNLTLSPECQLMIRHLLSHFFEIEAAYNDEFGVDINGISKRDMNAYATKNKSSWKRLSVSPTKTTDQY